MSNLAIILLEVDNDVLLKFDDCDVYTDFTIDKNLSYFEKLNRIGNKIRSIETNRDAKYNLIYLFNMKKYSIENINEDFFKNHFVNLKTKDSQIYTDNLIHGVFPSECKLSKNMMYMESVPFNFLSNFNRFYETLNKNLKTNSIENMLYIYAYMCKIKLYEIDKNFKIQFFKNLI